MEKEINFYGDNANYIHLKFGDVRKHYNFTKEFIQKYPDFAREYQSYFEGSRENNKSLFRNPFQIVEIVYSNKIPVHFYYNFTDTPAKNKREILAYLVRENSFISDIKSK